MTYLLRTPRDQGGDRVSRCVPDADRPAPYIHEARRYPRKGAQSQAWHGIWYALSGGLWFMVEDLVSFDPPIHAGLRPGTVARLLREAREAGLVTQRQRVRCGRGMGLEYSRVDAPSRSAVSPGVVTNLEQAKNGHTAKPVCDQPGQDSCEGQLAPDVCNPLAYFDPQLGYFAHDDQGC